MIRISVDTDDELEIVREQLVRSSTCPFINCNGKYDDCVACLKDNADRFIQITKRETVEVPVPLVV